MAEQSQKQAVSRRVPVDLNTGIGLTDPTGQKFRAVKIPVTLSVQKKTLTNTFGPVGVIVAAEGFIEMAANSGMITRFPDTVVANGREQPNGYRDPETGIIFYRAQAAGYTRLGQLVPSEATIAFDLGAYIVQDLLAKQSKHPNAFKLLPKGAKGPGDSWARYSIDEAVDLWLDLTYPEAFAWMKDAQQQKKFADRKAQKMALRNAIKIHPAVVELGIGKIQGDSVTVHTNLWAGDHGPIRLDKMIWSVDMDTKLLEAGATEGPKAVIDLNTDQEEAAAAHADEEVHDEEGGAPVDHADDNLPMDDAPAGAPAETAPAPEVLGMISDLKATKRAAALKKAMQVMLLSSTTNLDTLPASKIKELHRLVMMA
jgi:hypothetical protein